MSTLTFLGKLFLFLRVLVVFVVWWLKAHDLRHGHNVSCSHYSALIKVPYSAEPEITPGKGTDLAMDSKENLEKIGGCAAGDAVRPRLLMSTGE